MTSLFDAHNHLHDASLAPYRDRIFADLAAIGLRHAVVNGTCEADWPDVAALAHAHPLVLPSYGLHPWDVGNRTPRWKETLLACLDASPHAAVGEIGLDRWILDRARPDDPRLAGLRRAPIEEQIEGLRWQLAVAAERNLPATIHCLDAFGLLLETLDISPLPSRGFLLHAYSGPVEMVGAFARLGAYFSFNGGFLAPRKERLRALYAKIPLDRLLIETDAPAMAPPPEAQGFTLPPTAAGEALNHPANLACTYAALAELRGLTVDSLDAVVAENFAALFLPSP